MPAVVNMEKAAQARRKALMAASPGLPRLSRPPRAEFGADGPERVRIDQYLPFIAAARALLETRRASAGAVKYPTLPITSFT